MLEIAFLLIVAIVFWMLGYHSRIWAAFVAIVTACIILVFWRQGIDGLAVATVIVALVTLFGGNKYHHWRTMSYLLAEDHERELNYALNHPSKEM